MALSFKINKKASSTSAPVVLKSSVQTSSKRAFHDDDDKDDEEPDFIDGLEGTNIVSKKIQKKPEKQALVIPLISKNEWRTDKKDGDQHEEGGVAAEGKDANSQGTENGTVGSIKEQAIKELIEQANSKKSSDRKSSKTIPILFQNRVPDGYEEDDNMDVSLRPDQSTLDDYEQVPVEEFGLAVLRGMGWKETEGIGLKNKKVVDMSEPKLRPKGMGLGAEAAHLNKDVVPNTANSNNEEKEDLSFKIGGYAVITRGSKKGYYGQIESFDEDNNRVILRLGISGKMEAVSKFYIDIVSAKEYKKKSKVINSEKYEEYKAKQEKRDKERHAEALDMHHEYEEPEEPRRRKANRSSESDSDDDDGENYKSRSKSRRADRDDYDYEHRSDKRSGRKERNGDRHHKSSEKGRDRRDDSDRDRHTSSKYDSKRYDDRDRDRSRHDDHHRSSSRNGDKRGDRERDHHRSRKDDRDRRHRD